MIQAQRIQLQASDVPASLHGDPIMAVDVSAGLYTWQDPIGVKLVRVRRCLCNAVNTETSHDAWMLIVPGPGRWFAVAHRQRRGQARGRQQRRHPSSGPSRRRTGHPAMGDGDLLLHPNRRHQLTALGDGSFDHDGPPAVAQPDPVPAP
jgi:hypothetical protein